MSFIFNNEVQFEPGTHSVDPDGRLRVSQPFLLFSAEFLEDTREMFWDTTLSTNAIYQHNPNFSAVDFILTTTSGDEVIRQTKTYFRYTAGNSIVTHVAIIMPTAKAGLRIRCGQFSTEDGVFFERDGTTLNVVRRSNATGSVVDHKTAQANWNVDPMDGSGPSGITLDTSKFQVFGFEYEWYGGGSIRYLVKINGKNYTVHTEEAANNLDEPNYSTPALPVRYEATNTASTGSSSIIRQVGSSVARQGGNLEPNALQRAADMETDVVNVTTGSSVHLISIRLQPSFLKGQLRPRRFAITNVGGSTLHWELVRSATLNDNTWVSASVAAELNVAATTATGGTKIDSGYVQPRDTDSFEFDRDLLIALGSGLGGTSDTLTLRAISVGDQTDALAGITFEELS